ncbi:MAG TPA: hypothetical protein VIC82_12170 [Candidatus Nanopelagicales bacterium]
MNIRTHTGRRGVRRHRITLGIALPVALVAASVSAVPAAIASNGNPASAHLDRARTWTASALKAAAALAPAATTSGQASRAATRAVAPRVARAIAGPALLFSQVTAAGSKVGRLAFSTAATSTVATTGPACITLPRLSPDGNTIVAVTFSNGDCVEGTTTVATFDAATGTLLHTLDTLTASTTAGFDAPGWNPDGATILYTKWSGPGPQLYTVSAAGGTPTALGVAGLLDGAYSHDGSKIVAADVNDNDLHVMNSAGVVQSTITALTTPQAPAWSPDGSMISFSYDKAGGDNFGIGVVNAGGTGLLALPVTANDPNTNAFSSTWSDDGTQIFYDAFGQNPVTGAPTFAPAIFATDVAGKYRATVKSSSSTTVFVDPFFVLSGTPAQPSASTYTPIDPVRVQPVKAVGPGAYLDVKVAGVAGIPSGVSAVTLNLTGVNPTAGTFLTAYPKPSGATFPTVSNLNLAPKQIAAIAVQVTVSSDGYVRIRNNAGTTGVIVDVSGYFSTGTSAAGYVSLPAPVRALDTTIGPAASKVVTVAGLPGAPANPTAVVLNLTADHPTASTWESVVPSPLVGKPSVSSLNLPKGATRANLVTAEIGAGGKITVFNAFGSVRTIVDVIGYYASGASGLSYYPLNPSRILDTRYGTHTLGGSTGKIGKGGRLDLPTYGTTATATGITTVPTAAKAVVFNLTGVTPSSGTFLAAVASPNVATTSNVNLPPGAIVPNLVISAVGGATGAVRITNLNGTIAVVGDLAGYYAP